MPLRRRQRRLVGVPRADVARHFRRHLGDRSAGGGIERRKRQGVHRRAVLAHHRGVTAVATDVDVIPISAPSVAFRTDELPCGHFVTVFDNDVVQMRQDDVRAVTDVDGDVLAVVLGAALVVRVGDATDRGVHRIGRVVGRVQIDVVASRRRVMGIAPIGALRAERQVAFRKREVDGEEIDSPAHRGVLARRVVRPGTAERVGATLDVERRTAATQNGGCHNREDRGGLVRTHESLPFISSHVDEAHQSG